MDQFLTRLLFPTPTIGIKWIYVIQKVIGGGWYTVEKGLRQGCVPAPLLFNFFFAAFIKATYTFFKADKDIMDAVVHLLARVVSWVTSQTHYFSAEVMSPIIAQEGFLDREQVKLHH